MTDPRRVRRVREGAPGEGAWSGRRGTARFVTRSIRDGEGPGRLVAALAGCGRHETPGTRAFRGDWHRSVTLAVALQALLLPWPHQGLQRVDGAAVVVVMATRTAAG